MRRRASFFISAALVGLLSSQAWGDPPPDCAGLPDNAQLKTLLQGAAVVNNPALSPVLTAGPGDLGGLFGGTKMWAAVVNEWGELCALAFSTNDARGVWPGSKAIAQAKAYTANAFSLDTFHGGFPLSTANLYTFVQPGHSLNSLPGANPQNPEILTVPSDLASILGEIPGGIITFGGGVALYHGGQLVGGLGVSGDTSCTDHEIAKRLRDLAGHNPPGGPTQDDIDYGTVDGGPPSVFTHPLCPNTQKNETLLGDETPVASY